MPGRESGGLGWNETAAALVPLFPALKRMIPDLPELPVLHDADAAQFRLFQAYTEFMRSIAADPPALVILDDLHWADKPSLLLLQHLARDLAGMRLLVVGTYRDTDLARTHPLSEALADLNREPGFLRQRIGDGDGIVHDSSHMPIAVAMGVGLGAALVPGQLNFSVVFRVSEVDERKAGKVQPMRRHQAETVGVKLQRRLQMEHADHAVDDFGHGVLVQSEQGFTLCLCRALG